MSPRQKFVTFTNELFYRIINETHKKTLIIHISNINVMLISDEYTERKHSMLITFPISQNGYAKTRHIYVYADSSFVSVFFIN